MPLILGILLVLLLVAANGFFVAVEFALVAADRQRLDTLAADGRWSARAAKAARRRLSFHLAVTTVFQMVAGELIPKTIAVAKPEPVAQALSPIALVVHGALSPIIRLLNGAANATVRVLGMEPQEELEEMRSLEERQEAIHVVPRP